MNKKNKGQNTKQQIVEKATTLITKNGYNHTSLNQILKATGLAKGGFYFHFKSKEELGMAVIQSLEECWKKTILPRMLQGKCAKEKLEIIFSAPGDCSNNQDFRPTVLLLILAIEMLEVNDKFSKMLKRIITGWWSMIETIIEEGKIENLFKEEIDATAVAAIILSNIMGANLLAMLNGSSEIYSTQLSALKSVLFDGISKSNFQSEIAK